MSDTCEIPKSSLHLEWEVHLTDVSGNAVTRYLLNANECIEYCGELIFGQTLIELMFLSVHHMLPDQPEKLGVDYHPEHGKAPRWIVKTYDRSGAIGTRQLSQRHEVFSTVAAELKRGASIVEVTDVSCCTPLES